MDKTNITCIILTKNEEKNIARCLESIKELAERIVIVDSGSTDGTLEIAKGYNADIYHHEFENYARQFNWAIDNVGIKTNWVYRIDADESISEELRKEILEEVVKHNNDDINGFVMKFKVYFMGKWLKHGGVYPFYNLTIFKYGFARYEERKMGEHLILSSGKTIDLRNDCDHYDFKNLSIFINKHNWYATREVNDYFELREGKKISSDLYKEAKKAKKLRDGFYYKLPLFFRAKLYYWYRYYLKFGFLDGKPGKIYAMIQAYFYRFIVDAKIYECKKLNYRYEDTRDLK